MKIIVYIAGVLTVSIAGGQWATHTWAACVDTGVSLATYNGNWVAAFNAAIANGSNLVTVPAGTWPSPQILPPMGMTIKGAGASYTFVTRNARGVNSNGGIFKVTTPNVAITDLTVRGWPITSGLSDDIGINGINATKLTVQRVNLESMQGIGIQTEGAPMTGCLIEDVKITNTMVRYNGYHGVALWLYKGTSSCTYRRITINGAANTGIAIDAGTTGDSNARSVDNNVFDDITIVNVGAKWGAVLITGGQSNRFTNIKISDLPSFPGGPAFAFGIDQSGLGSNGNTFTGITLARVASGDLAWIDARVCKNTFDGGNGSWIVFDPGHCNTFRNWPGLVIR